MGWRYRKSFNLGGGFRINLSKSGVGYSWGIPGFRKTRIANGRVRKTYSIKGTGISYIKEKGKPGDNKAKQKEPGKQLILGETQTYKNTKVNELSDRDELYKRISNLRLINAFSDICIVSIVLIYLSQLFVILLALGIILKVLLAKRWSVFLEYKMDSYKEREYEYLLDSLSYIAKSSAMWQINESTHVVNSRYNAGAKNNISRMRIFPSNKLPIYIKCEKKIISFSLKNGRVFFLPDRMMFFNGITSVYGKEYGNTTFELGNTKYVEESAIPRDATIIGHTWQYANNDGSPDKRFTHNKQFPICKYGSFRMRSTDGLNTYICFSDISEFSKIGDRLMMFSEYHNESSK